MIVIVEPLETRILIEYTHMKDSVDFTNLGQFHIKLKCYLGSQLIESVDRNKISQ